MKEKVKIQEEYLMYINGQWTKGSTGNTLDCLSPADGSKITTIIDATNEDVDLAIAAANEALPRWKNISIEKRSELLLKIADLIDDNAEHLALIESIDNGKPIRETISIDIPASADHFRYFAGVIRSEEGNVQAFDEDTISIVLREPIGVIGQIIPWNFPLLMAAWKLAPALAMGNTIVIHPSSSTSLSILELAKLLDQVLPQGVVNIITGKGSKSGEYMLHHPGLAKLAFTGSTEVGYRVAQAAADRLIPATLELGGKSANIFFDDCNIEKALEGAQLGIIFNQGQVCCAGSRIFVQEGIYDSFVEKLITAFKKIKVGLPWDFDTQMGAQINEQQVKDILAYIDIARNEGATIATGGYRLTDNEFQKGCYLAPTLITDVSNDMRVAQEEIFGPVAVVIKFKDANDVIKMANDSQYGLAAGVWTKDINTALKVSRALESGRVWVNTYNQLPAGAPFGGYKKSGIGRETYKSMIDAYSQTKNIFISTTDGKLGLF
ncbi:MAG: aldehyde dehydrogenase family protein [Bacilli bacterium]|jgi:acyl-CoA reductase-like NAD-dependent aldehyde dehydrogenase|nr:aldehyde dehydrogenase family protein [Bacilli bacterium]